MSPAKINQFLKRLEDSPDNGAVFNPWYHVDANYDASPDAPRCRRQNLQKYLEERLTTATHLLVAEAPGFRGCKFSGIAMTCERQLGQRTSCERRLPKPADRKMGMIEPTASIVAKLLVRLSIDPTRIVLWNTFAWHPHRPANRLTNRTPTPIELQHGLPVLRAMIELFPKCELIAIGKTAQRTIEESLNLAVPAVRHPANGGATLFANQMATLMK